jgi:hypothetical protein
MATIASFMAAVTCADVTWSIRLKRQKADMGVLSLAFSYDLILRTMAAAILTGHMLMLPDPLWVMVLFFLSFFCIANVIDMQSENSSCGSLCSISFLSLKNLRLRRRRMSVCRFSAWVTLRYSHDRIAKKIATVVSCPMAFCNSVVRRFAISAIKHMGMAFCCFCLGSLLAYDQYCCCRRKQD